jgi:hypothetical protein
MAAGPAMDLSAYAGQRLSASKLRAATADIMADITALLAKIRQETPPYPGIPPQAAVLFLWTERTRVDASVTVSEARVVRPLRSGRDGLSWT